ncbi:MAG: SDR family NAD(P)-dependent oxidoreductase [Myxococcota bacterium]
MVSGRRRFRDRPPSRHRPRRSSDARRRCERRLRPRRPDRLVTGGTRGIGRAIAHEPALAGARVFLTGRDPAEASRVAAALGDATGRSVEGLGYEAGTRARAAR